MDGFMVVMRLIHIFAAVYWVGAGMFVVAMLLPAVRAQGTEGDRFFLGFLKHTRFELSMPVSALLTTLAGLALYDRVSDHFNSDWMQSDAGIVLSIGSLAGIAAFLHGGAAIGRTTGKYRAALAAVFEGQDPTQEQRDTLARVRAKVMRQAPTSVVLQLIALAGMAAARYM